MPTVTQVDKGDRAVSRRVTVASDIDTLFALVADPHRHGEIDGSGTVKDTVNGPDRLSGGDKFSVKMKQFGVPYRITSTVRDFTDRPDFKAIEWQHPLGHSWRWEFAPALSGGTEVTETFVYGTAKSPKMLELFKMPQANAKGITSTLEMLAARYQ